MFKLPWSIKFQRRPRPLPQEFQDLVEIVDQLAEHVAEVRKMAEATQRKVYRDAEKDNHEPEGPDLASLGTTAPAEADAWRTGDPAV